MNQIDSDTPLFHLTVGQLESLIRDSVLKMTEELKSTFDSSKKDKSKRYAHSLKEFGDALGVSVVTACELKNSGVIDSAVSQWRRTMIIDIDKAIELLSEHRKSCKSRRARS